MTKRTDSSSTSPSEIEALREKLRVGELNAEDKQLLDKSLGLLLRLIFMLEQKKQSISKLQRMLFGPKTDTRATDATEDQQPPASVGEETHRRESEVSSSSEAKTEEKKPGHGRHPHAAYTGATVVACQHTALQVGDVCPDEFCTGHLYDPTEQVVFIQLAGQPPVSATKYDQEVLRCTACFARYTASLPDGVPQEKYCASADVAIAIWKHGAGMPFTRLAKLQQSFGVPLPASVQFQRCEAVADAVLPIFLCLKRMAAQAEVLYTDDTRVKILSCLQENKALTQDQRKGLHTTGIVAVTSEHRIALYISGRRHCGENVAELLKERDSGLPLVRQMADALSANWSVPCERIICKCLVHARRQFVEIERNFPQPCQRVLDAIGWVYKVETETTGMTAAQRLMHHQGKSGAVMRELQEFITEELAEKRVEPNSSLGKAYQYVLNHWDGLTRWLRVEGCPLDNNECERSLKLAVLNRKNALFYKTEDGALIGDILMSLIKTCELNGVAAFDYLHQLMRHREQLRHAPDDWLPWNYQCPRDRMKLTPSEVAKALAA